LLLTRTNKLVRCAQYWTIHTLGYYTVPHWFTFLQKPCAEHWTLFPRLVDVSSESSVFCGWFQVHLHWPAVSSSDHLRDTTSTSTMYHTGRTYVFTHQVTALFCVKWRQGHYLETVASIKIWPSIDVYLLEEESCQISYQSNLKWYSLRLFWKGCPNKNKKTKNKMSSDMRLSYGTGY